MTEFLVKPEVATGTFYELPDYQRETFAPLVAEGYARTCDMQNIAVLEHGGKTYIAATSGTVALFYPCSGIECGDYEGLPFMRRVINSDRYPGRLQQKLVGFLDSITTHTAYKASIFPRMDTYDNEDYRDYGNAKIGSVSVLLGMVVDDSFVIDAVAPYKWVFDHEKFNDVFDAMGANIARISVGTPSQPLVFHNDALGAFAVLMPMKNSAGVQISGWRVEPA